MFQNIDCFTNGIYSVIADVIYQERLIDVLMKYRRVVDYRQQRLDQ